MRGRKPKPTKLKLICGNPGKRPINEREPEPSADLPACPGWLDEEAKAEWVRVAPELSRLGVLTSIDANTLAGYCQAVAEHEIATRTIQQEGRTYSPGALPERPKGRKPKSPKPILGPTLIKAHPAVAQQRTAWAAIRAFASLFGIDPSSRSRLQVGKGADDENRFEQFVKRGQKKA